ncbi:MAG: hypothetical protein ABI068_17815, partial [Ktedonobacterales bacterium]
QRVAADDTLVVGAGGVPVARYVPSIYGAPVGPDRLRADEVAAGSPLVARTVGYRPVWLPPPIVQPARRRLPRAVKPLAAMVVLLVALALVAQVVATAQGASYHLGPLTLGAVPHATHHAIPTPTATLTCALPVLDPTARRALTQAQLTTGVRNLRAKDYRPVNSVSSFTIGQQAYLTFKVTSNVAGTASVAFCTPQQTFTGVLPIPARSANRYAEFSMTVAAQNVGQCVAVLRWQGDVAAVLPFTIVRV